MSTRTTWRWSSLLVVVMMIVSMAAATVSASPAPARPETATAAPAWQFPSPEATKPPLQGQPPVQGEGKSDEALSKLAPELRPIAKARSPELVLVTVLMQAGTKVQPYFQRVVVRKPIGGLQWATGEIRGANLLKLASLPGVISVVSFQSYAPVPAPDDDFRGGIGYRPPSLKLERGRGAQVKEALRKLTAGMSPEQVREKLRTDPAFRAKVSEILGRPLPERPALPEKPSLPPQGGIQPATIKVRDVHGASAAWTKGYTGTGRGGGGGGYRRGLRPPRPPGHPGPRSLPAPMQVGPTPTTLSPACIMLLGNPLSGRIRTGTRWAIPTTPIPCRWKAPPATASPARLT
jgi:hypothetical protein